MEETIKQNKIPPVLVSANALKYPWGHRECVYFLIHSSRIVYVGRTNGLGQRLSLHKRNLAFEEVYYLPTPSGANLGKIETAWIRYLKPIFNGHRCEFREQDRKLLAEHWPEALRSAPPDNLTPVEPEGYGAVYIISGSRRGELAYYDDDDLSLEEECHSCAGGSDDESACTCKYISTAIVYPDSWNDGYILVPHSDLVYVPEDSADQKVAVEKLLLPEIVRGAMGIY